MAGQTKGTYRSKANGGQGVPTPPVMDLAYLKSWWDGSPRREPHANPKGNTGRTKSERRALRKLTLGIGRKGRLPVGVAA